MMLWTLLIAGGIAIAVIVGYFMIVGDPHSYSLRNRVALAVLMVMGALMLLGGLIGVLTEFLFNHSA